MARIPQETIDRLKREVSIADLAVGRGITLQRHGEDNLMARCPWHDDSTPSLCISPSKNLWHCLGACQQGGDVIQWVMKMENVGFRHAVELLLAGDARELQPKKRSAPHLPQIDLGEDDRALKDIVTRYYGERLHAPTSPDGLEYLERRAIRNDELIERFRIGFADRTLGFRVPMKEYKAGREMRERLERVGFFRETTGREHFNGCVTFPLFDEAGEVVQMYGRKIRDDVRFKHGSHLYLPAPHRGVWNREGIASGEGTVIVCEALIDAATFWCAGYRNVTAAYGVNGFTSELLASFKQHAITRVLIAYDRDEAGDKAAEQLALSLAREGIAAWRVIFPRLMDANDYARKVTPAAQSLGVLLRAAEWMNGPKQRPGVTLPAAVAGEDERPAAPAIATNADASEPATHDEAAPPNAPLFSLAASSSPDPPCAPEPPAEPDRTLAVSDYSTIDLSFGDRRYRVRGAGKEHELAADEDRAARGTRRAGVPRSTGPDLGASSRGVREASGDRSRRERRSDQARHRIGVSPARGRAGRDDPQIARAESSAAADE